MKETSGPGVARISGTRATLDHSGDDFSPAYSSELRVILLTFSPMRGCVSLLRQ